MGKTFTKVSSAENQTSTTRSTRKKRQRS